jgi:predicted site-specific integrase-resolvase
LEWSRKFVNIKRNPYTNLLKVVVAHRDRLARLGCELLEFVFEKAGTKLVVHGERHEDEHDLASDLLAVTSLFVASYNGRRSAENQRRRRQEKKDEGGSQGKKRRKETQVGAEQQDFACEESVHEPTQS